MSDVPKLIIYNRDGTTTEVEPIKPWSPCYAGKDGKCPVCGKVHKEETK